MDYRMGYGWALSVSPDFNKLAIGFEMMVVSTSICAFLNDTQTIEVVSNVVWDTATCKDAEQDSTSQLPAS
jgi:hypothetical protein